MDSRLKTNIHTLKKEWLNDEEARPMVVAMVIQSVLNNQILPALGRSGVLEAKVTVMSEESKVEVRKNAAMAGNLQGDGPFSEDSHCFVVRLEDLTQPGTLERLKTPLEEHTDAVSVEQK